MAASFDPGDELASNADGIAALADPVRRRLYLFVSRQADAVSREQAAAAVDVATHTAKFHLERLADEGLLDVEFRTAHRQGRTRSRSTREALSPLRARDRRLAAAAPLRPGRPDPRRGGRAGERHHGRRRRRRLGGGPPRGSGHRRSRVAPRRRAGPHGHRPSSRVGYEPRVEDSRLVLENCPFDRLAQDHTALVCGLNLEYVEGVIEGLGCQRLTAALEPSPARCCVVADLAEGNAP